MMKETYVHQQQYGNAPIQVATPMSNVSVQPANRQDVFMDKHMQVRRTCTHKTAILLSFVTCGAALNIALGQVLGMVIQQPMNWIEMLVRLYEISFSILVVINECQWTHMIKESLILQSYTWRGILYIFVGILGVMMNDIGMNRYYQKQWNKYGNYNSNNITIYIPTQEQVLELYIRVVSWSMFVFGVIYVIMGLLRQKQKVDRHIEEYEMRKANMGQWNGKTSLLCGVIA